MSRQFRAGLCFGVMAGVLTTMGLLLLWGGN